jgi:hypothetical protein
LNTLASALVAVLTPPAAAAAKQPSTTLPSSRLRRALFFRLAREPK